VDETWTHPDSHWKATGRVESDGAMTDASVDDNQGRTRYLGASFWSKEAFIAWAGRWTRKLRR
jgi:hypothetical protein